MISPKAIKFARAMALVSQSLPIPAVAAASAFVVACDDKPAEHPMGTVAAPEPVVGTEVPPQQPKPIETAVGTTATATPPAADAGMAPIVEPKVGTMTAPEPDVGKKVAPEVKVGKKAAPEQPKKQ